MDNVILTKIDTHVGYFTATGSSKKDKITLC